jgi:hypothetical protein
MRRLFLAWILPAALLPATLAAQNGNTFAVEQKTVVAGPSYSQTYCSGFISHDPLPRTSYVLGSKESPHADRYGAGAVLFLRGPELAAGTRYSIVRQVFDPNRENSSGEEVKRLAELGGLYEDIGWVTVNSIENGTAVATFDFSCSAAVASDLIVPFTERPQLGYRAVQAPLGGFRARSAGGLKGHILGAKDFLGMMSPETVVYTDFGSTKGAKPGDYLVITRGYAAGDLNKIDRASQRIPRGQDPTAVEPARVPREADTLLPDHVLGEMMVLSVTPESSTALITRVAAEVELGDVVELENADGTPVASAAPSSGEAAPEAQPAGIRKIWNAVRDKAEAWK